MRRRLGRPDLRVVLAVDITDAHGRLNPKLILLLHGQRVFIGGVAGTSCWLRYELDKWIQGVFVLTIFRPLKAPIPNIGAKSRSRQKPPEPGLCEDIAAVILIEQRFVVQYLTVDDLKPLTDAAQDRLLMPRDQLRDTLCFMGVPQHKASGGAFVKH